VAPEVLKGRYNEKCDAWSLGVLAYILLDGRAPFMGRDDRATYKLIKSGVLNFPSNRWDNISKEARDFVICLLQVNPSNRLSAEKALQHPWLATSVGEDEPLQLDAAVLEGLRTFTRGNAVRRAVLCALAPLATVDEVGKWADMFEALDENCTGTVLVKDLAESLMRASCATEAEAAALSAALAAGDGGEEISYSAFLAACLCAHHAEDKQMRELFGRLDVAKTGKISVQQVGSALGDIVDMEALSAELGADEL
ncbi:unnamed protein product, partial [Polarella glacialis]